MVYDPPRPLALKARPTEQPKVVDRLAYRGYRGGPGDQGPTRARLWLRRMAFVMIIALVPIGWSYGAALSTPGGGGIGLRSVEWIRGHGGAGLVVAAENFWYSHHAPPKGGKPPPGYIPAPTSQAGGGTGTGSNHTLLTSTGMPYLPPPAPIVPIVSPALPGEGDWTPIGRDVGGVPAAYKASIRPDPAATSVVAGIAWMDPKLLSAKLFAGPQDPGGTGWKYMAPIPTDLQPSLVTAFNSGFRMQDANGGFYAYGRTGVPLVNGAASFVIYNNGTVNVGTWGTGSFRLGPTVAAVRQNLTLIVNSGAPLPGLASDTYTQWGTTLGNKVLVWRSGIGVTANGALVYVAGDYLSVASLANVLAHAGAVRAMEMDINSDWTSFFSFDPASGQPAQPSNATKLLPDMVQATTLYFQPWQRDFIAMFAR